MCTNKKTTDFAFKRARLTEVSHYRESTPQKKLALFMFGTDHFSSVRMHQMQAKVCITHTTSQG